VPTVMEVIHAVAELDGQATIVTKMSMNVIQVPTIVTQVRIVLTLRDLLHAHVKLVTLGMAQQAIVPRTTSR